MSLIQDINIELIWTAAGFVFGFQTTAIVRRADRMVEREKAIRDERERNKAIASQSAAQSGTSSSMNLNSTTASPNSDSTPPKPRYLPPSEYLNLGSMFIIVVFVFGFPSLNIITEVKTVVRFFVLSLILFLGYAFALYGHYNIYKFTGPRENLEKPSPQETRPVLVTILVAILYVLAWMDFLGVVDRAI